MSIKTTVQPGGFGDEGGGGEEMYELKEVKMRPDLFLFSSFQALMERKHEVCLDFKTNIS